MHFQGERWTDTLGDKNWRFNRVAAFRGGPVAIRRRKLRDLTWKLRRNGNKTQILVR